MAYGGIFGQKTIVDAFTKDETWKDATAALFGLGVDSVPDDGFAYLGKYAQHWWRRRAVTRTVEVDLGNLETGGIATFKGINTDDSPYPVQCATALEVVGTSDVSLKNPETVNLTYSSMQTDVLALRNRYFFNSNGALIYAASTMDYGGYSMSGGTVTLSIKNFYKPTTTIQREDGPWEYVQSSDRSAYPDSGEQDGYEYEYMGVPFDNAVNSTKIETGSYTGTGTYGSSNPNSLTFGFVPKVVVFVEPKVYNGNPIHVIFLNGGASVIEYVNGDIHISFSGNSVSWYTPGDAASDQMNAGATSYYYFAIG